MIIVLFLGGFGISQTGPVLNGSALIGGLSVNTNYSVSVSKFNGGSGSEPSKVVTCVTKNGTFEVLIKWTYKTFGKIAAMRIKCALFSEVPLLTRYWLLFPDTIYLRWSTKKFPDVREFHVQIICINDSTKNVTISTSTAWLIIRGGLICLFVFVKSQCSR